MPLSAGLVGFLLGAAQPPCVYPTLTARDSVAVDSVRVPKANCAKVQGYVRRLVRAGQPADLHFLDSNGNYVLDAAEVRALCKYVVAVEEQKAGRLPYARAKRECP